MEDLEKALHSLPSVKCPDHDDFPREFYVAFRDDIKELVFDAVQTTRVEASIGSFFNTSLICLYPKGGDVRHLGQWLPITLLTNFYKIISKSIALRMQPHMVEWLEEEQRGFVKG